MKIGGVGRVRSGVSYSPPSRMDQLVAWAQKQIVNARKKGESEVSFFIKDNKETAKMMRFLQKNFEVHTEKSDSVKVTVKL